MYNVATGIVSQLWQLPPCLCVCCMPEEPACHSAADRSLQSCISALHWFHPWNRGNWCWIKPCNR